jgi:hypothetical protein
MVGERVGAWHFTLIFTVNSIRFYIDVIVPEEGP